MALRREISLVGPTKEGGTKIVQVPMVGLGTWQSPPGMVAKAVQTALEAGYRHIDAAAVYGNEKEVGEGIKASGVPRKDIFITSKLWNNSHRPDRVEKALDETLYDLKTDYVDLYLIHWPASFDPTKEKLEKDYNGEYYMDKEKPSLESTWKEMERIYLENRKVRAIGVSNFTMREINEITKNGAMKPMMVQIEVHPYLAQVDYVKKLQSLKIQVTAYSPFGNQNRSYRNAGEAKRLIEHPKVQEIADKHRKTTAQVLVSYAQARGMCVVPKSVTPERIESNFKDFEMDEEDVKELNGLNQNLRFNRLICGYDMFVE